MRRAVARVMVVATAVGGLVGAGTVGAGAAWAGCAPDAGYSTYGLAYHDVDMVSYSSAPGGHTLSIAISKGTTTTATISGSATAEEGIIIASAKETFGISLAKSWTASVTYTDSWKVPSSWSRGQLHAGSEHATYHWQYGQYNGACKWIVARSGTMSTPHHEPAFWDVKG